jgi:predicted RNA-binding Zn-ribbon protein involved in translation (DUF1610 family)
MTDTAPSPGILILPDEMAAHKADLIDVLAQLMPDPPRVQLEREYAAGQLTATGGLVLPSVSEPSYRPLRDAIPSFAASRGTVCYHGGLPSPEKGLVFRCPSACGKTFVAKHRRPKQDRSPCPDCGRRAPKVRKLKKRWVWVAVS